MSQVSLTIAEKGTMMIALHNAIRWEESLIDSWKGVDDKTGRETIAACQERILDYKLLQAKLRPATRPTQLSFL